MPGWTGPVDIHRDLTASEGFQVVDLNQDGPGFIGQSIPTLPGQSYAVRWAQGTNFFCAASAQISLDVDGLSVGTFDSSATPAYREAVFTATGSTTSLRFRSLTPGCGAATIDDVSVACR